MSPLIQVSELANQLGQTDLVLVDCRHDLTQPEAGRLAYEQGHLPGAVFAHLDHDLSGPKTGRNGRHPLPDPAQLERKLAALGIGTGSHIVAYDAHGGIFSARLWWLLKWVGFQAVQVLDGGVNAWLAAGGQLDTMSPSITIGALEAQPNYAKVVDAETVLDNLDRQEFMVIDARAPGRFAGEGETMDPVAGHIPGAMNRFFQLNLQADGRFKPAEMLRNEWKTFLDGRDAHDTVQQCGSGVTACHNLLALEIAGLPGSRLYPGSWSEWCADPSRPVARGAAD
ncbi:sulfurtransferase [Chitinimonas sp. BJB300]|uniref:sulfurtransferase n=1 Tax=Chitinimonas sp. BJB300 TaxID=1559339 RepID=UPI000C0C7876|nr:sulfurtransferase [Chitinimonas sp. BJB300]PHV13476.1 sulfurtransferase [Chitinimonas sp. BJB300]TSJ89839.1 sulfurtransferase [Chitinimonas sp. BJB300]